MHKASYREALLLKRLFVYSILSYVWIIMFISNSNILYNKNFINFPGNKKIRKCRNSIPKNKRKSLAPIK